MAFRRRNRNKKKGPREPKAPREPKPDAFEQDGTDLVGGAKWVLPGAERKVRRRR